MQNKYYQKVRENIRIDNSFTYKNVEDETVVWSNVIETLNHIVYDKIFAFRNGKTSDEDIDVGCISEEFKFVLQEENKNNVPDLFEKCRLTKKKTLIKLFTVPDDQRPKDFDPKTKDFFAIFCGRLGWRDFLADERGEIVPDEKEELEENFFQQLREGSKSYFKELTSTNCRYGHYEINNEERFIETTTLHKKSNKTFPLFKALQSLWYEDSKHTVLIGEGGMGKTLSFIRWWQFFLEDESAPIPIYISLNEYNTNKTEDKNYLIKYIAWNYLGIKPLDENTEQRLRKVFVDRTAKQKLDFILLLDGFNEITTDKSALLDDINRNWKTKAWNTQIVVSSRYDMRYSFNFSEFHLLEINALPKKVIVNYLIHYKVSFLSISNFQSLLENPMMLSLYANSAPAIEKYHGNPNFDFKPIESQGELLWNYFESQYVKYFEYYSSNEGKAYFYRFLFKHYLPFVGYEMEKKGKYFLAPKELDEILKQTGNKFYSQKFTNTFREFRKFIRYFNLKSNDDVFEEDERIEKFVDIISKELQVLIVENNNFWFQHQNFRDYFASLHIINEMEVQIIDNELPDILSERVLPIYLQRFIGQIEGEHHYKPAIVEDIGWSIDYKDTFTFDNKVPKTKSIKLLDLCRNKFDKKEIERVIQNLISILNVTREELSGIDLSELNLLKSHLNGMRFFKKHKNNYLSAKFDSSIISEDSLFYDGHSGVISCVVYSPDGKRMATASFDCTIKEWSVTTGNYIRTYSEHSDSVKSVTYRFDGKMILSMSWDGTVKEYSTETGECIRTIEETDGIRSAIYSPDGNIILYGLSNIGIKKLSVETNQIISTDEGKGYNIDTLCFNKKGDKFLSGSGSILQEWDASTMKCIHIHDFKEGSINKVIYMPNDEDNVLCSSSLHGRLGILSLSQKKQVKQFKIEDISEETILDLMLSNNGKKVLAATSKGNVYLWDIKSKNKKPKQKFEISKSKEYVNSVAFSSDSQKFSCCPLGKAAEEWSLTTGLLLRYFGSGIKRVNAISYSPCGTKFISGTQDGVIQEWDRRQKKCTNVYLGHTEPINDISYSPEGKTIISCSDDKTLKLWSVETSVCLHTFTEHKDNVYAVTYSKDGTMIASCSRDKTINIWSVKEKRKIQTIKNPDFRIFDVCFSPDGTKILSASLSIKLKEWSVETGEFLKEYYAHQTSIYSCDYSPDGKKVISGSRDSNIKLWDAETGKCLNTVHAQNNGVHHVRFSPDGKKVLSCGNNIYLYEWVIGEEQKDEDKIEAHKENIMQVAYSPDGERALSCSDDGTIKEWLVENWSCIETYEYVNGLYIHGCTFKDLHEDSKISKNSKKILEKYGAIFSIS